MERRQRKQRNRKLHQDRIKPIRSYHRSQDYNHKFISQTQAKARQFIKEFSET
jgi:hypothetical protein